MNTNFSKAFFEITNICNADCSFCPKTKREKEFIDKEHFELVLSKLEGRIEHLYFHLMGEPLLHPDVSFFAKIAKERGFKVMLTTNGILASTKGREVVGEGNIHKISISLHSFEANKYNLSLDEYLTSCFELASFAPENGTIAVMRLWNSDEGKNNSVDKEFSAYVISSAEKYFSENWIKSRSGYKLRDKLFIEFGDSFEWPTQSHRENIGYQFCYALRNQIGILCDGTVVPCCLDSDGNMSLGNIFYESFDEIINCERAKAIYNNFSNGVAVEETCKTCGFVRRFAIG